MKEKIKILSISKRDYRSEFIFPKEQILFGILREFLIKLGFDEGEEYGVNSLGRPFSEETERPILDKEEDINNYNQKVENYANDIYSVDIIYFSDKVTIILNYREDKQKEIGDALAGLSYEEN